MAEAQSLLSLIARGYAAGREDAATEALCFILSRSDSAREALSEFLGNNDKPLRVASFRTQLLVAGAFPDMVCFDTDGRCLAFVESKFWAALTPNQPVTYWNALPGDRSTTLLFLAPAARIAQIDKDSLWSDLVKRLHDAGHALGPVNRGQGPGYGQIHGRQSPPDADQLGNPDRQTGGEDQEQRRRSCVLRSRRTAGACLRRHQG